MADTKISADTTVTPAGVDFIPVVQGGANKKATIASLPVSTPTQAALNAKQDTLVSGTNIKTINSTSLLGSGDIVISGTGLGDVVGPASATDNAIARYNATTGKLIKNSGVTISDTNVLTTAGTIDSSLTASEILGTNASKQLVSLAVATYPSLTELAYVKGVTSAIQTQISGKQASGSYEVTTAKDATGGYAGLTLFKINFKNALNTITSFFTNANTVARTYTFPDKDITVAGLVDITGTNSNINTGDQTIANTSDATSHTATLSAAGGSVKLVEGTGITLTTSGTSVDGIVTIASTGGGGLTNFTEGVNTSAPNATVPVVSMNATNAAANVDVAIVPKGTGAFTLAVADNATTGGNKRGNNAIDLQMGRAVNTRVASGINSITIGIDNTASNISTTAIGSLNTVSGPYSTAIGRNNSTSGSQSTAIGSLNTVSGSYSTAMGLYNTSQSFGETTLGVYATIGAGTAGSHVATDRLLVVGNGISTGARSDAITVLKNGNTTIAGTLAASNLSNTNTGDNAANTNYTIGSQTQAYNANLTAINQALTTTSSPSFTTVTAALTGTASGNLVSGGALGTPSSATLTNATGLPAASVVAGILGVTGTRMTKLWATDIESTNAPTVGGVTIPTISSTSTITNKRNTKRVVSTTQAAAPAINTDNGDIFEIVGLAQAITSMTTNLTGTPVEGDLMQIIFKDNATARAITWGASFVATGVALPTTTVISTPLTVLFQYRTSAVWTATSAWYCLASV